MMRANTLSYPIRCCVLAALTVAGLGDARPVLAQDDGYHIGENRSTAPATPLKASPTHRVARIDYLSGGVSYRPNDGDRWMRAELKHSMLEGGQLKLDEGSRAEISFDDGSILRLGSHTLVTLQTVFVDNQGEYTQIKLNRGIAMLEPRDERSVFEVNTPFVGLKTIGPSRIRIGVGDDVEVAVSRGRANLEASQGKTTLSSGDFIAVRSDDETFAVRALPAPDSWERWNEDRDRKMPAQASPESRTSPPSRSGLSIFFSLGFPIFGGDRRSGYHYYGRAEYHGEYHHR